MSIRAKRKRIDAIDQRLVSLLNRRAQLAAQLGRMKHAAGLRVRDPRRECQVLRRVRRSNGGPLDGRAIALLWNRILHESRRVERRAIRNAHARSRR